MLPAPRMFLLAATNLSQHLSRPSQMPLSPFLSRLSTGLQRALGPVRIACMCLHTVLRLRVSRKYRVVRMNNEASGCAGSLCDCMSTGQVGDTGDGSDNADDVQEEVGGKQANHHHLGLIICLLMHWWCPRLCALVAGALP